MSYIPATGSDDYNTEYAAASGHGMGVTDAERRQLDTFEHAMRKTYVQRRGAEDVGRSRADLEESHGRSSRTAARRILEAYNYNGAAGRQQQGGWNSVRHFLRTHRCRLPDGEDEPARRGFVNFKEWR